MAMLQQGLHVNEMSCFYAAVKVKGFCKRCTERSSLPTFFQICVKCWPAWVEYENLCDCGRLTAARPQPSLLATAAWMADESVAGPAGQAAGLAAPVAAAGPTPTIAAHAPQQLLPPLNLLSFLRRPSEIKEQRNAIGRLYLQHMEAKVQRLRSELKAELRKRKAHELEPTTSSGSTSDAGARRRVPLTQTTDDVPTGDTVNEVPAGES
jgi:hypothetical protein